MSWIAAKFFAYVQGANFYRGLHERAVHLLPSGAGKVWFDVGCGPGLVARLAAAHGYRTTGFDIDPDMVEQAKMNPQNDLSAPEYEVAGIDGLLASGRKANVISAASLLAVLDDKEQALQQLMSCLADGGTLLVIETTDFMNPATVWEWLKQNGFGNRNWILLLWAWTRAQGRAVNPADMNMSGCRIERVNVFGDLVCAWFIRRTS